MPVGSPQHFNCVPNFEVVVLFLQDGDHLPVFQLDGDLQCFRSRYFFFDFGTSNATGYRTGRSIGMAYLESPELKHGDKTVLEAGMTFAVDGGISVDGELGGRIGDSIVVTETGYEYLTEYPRQLLVVNR